MSDALPELEYLGALRRLKKQALELSADAAALNYELQPESLAYDQGLSELLHHLDYGLQYASEAAEQALRHTEIVLAMRGFSLDARDQLERDTD